jgi:hypothetical protein
VIGMKHPSNREFFAYWDKVRGTSAAPDRSSFAPEPVRHLLGDIFVLGYDPACGYPFRIAGTRLCARLGRDVKGESFPALFTGSAHREIEDLLGIVAEETMPTVAGVTAAASEGDLVHFELLLLPFSQRAHTPLSLTGQMAALTEAPGTLSRFSLTSWRHLDPDLKPRGPRVLHKLEIARGIMVYEGLF